MACFLFECSMVIGTIMPGSRSVTISVEGGTDVIGGDLGSARSRDAGLGSQRLCSVGKVLNCP
jgi:Cft2 family RNA processing exonuclease